LKALFIKGNRKAIQHPNSIDILGVRVDDVTMCDTLSFVEEMIESGKPHQILPVNPEMIMTAQKNPAFRAVLNNAALVLPDGVGVLLASHFLGHPISERVTGVDMVGQLAALAKQRGWRLFLLGAAPGIAERAAQSLQARHKGLVIAGTYSGSPDSSEEEEICRRIEMATPHILLVAYGAPRQEMWIDRNLSRLNVPVGISVGGTFDFIAGAAVRSPAWMQRVGLEWLYRLMRQPSRCRRMLMLPRFALAVMRNRASKLT
jgi:N-acetylglucosaminyldiphosphoundecaprenol N-acetyl-beta-D-mannosaminyltransferase